MIVVSLLLILVAVTLLVLGLVGGSSALLISSIVASLLAAVALVIGARQAAAARRSAVPVPGEPDLDPAGAGADAYAADYAAADDAALPTPDVTQRVYPDVDLHDDEAAGRTFSGQDAGAAPAAEDLHFDPPAAVDDMRHHETPPVDPEPYPDGPAPDLADVPSGRDRAEDAEPVEEFDEPDPEDPDDEPLPQAVRPADAVRVARLDAEVLVVDGRPRYHLADCAHLVGRLTEGLPVAEAVELGFSPCGLCRPVERLVSAVRH
jgi:hypothetical protein